MSSIATENMINMYDWLDKDGVKDVQIVENGTGTKLYFWPIPKMEEDEVFCGFFFSNEKEAEKFREHLGGFDRFFSDIPVQHRFDYIYMSLTSLEDTLKITAEGMGDYKRHPELVPNMTNLILNFFDTDNLSFEDMSLMYKTDLKLSESELEELLLEVIGYYQDVDKARTETYKLKESPRTGRKFYASPTRIDESKKNSLASFMIVKRDDLEGKVEAALEEKKKRVNLNGCLMFMVVSRQGKLKYVDVALQDYETMSRDERREMVLDFLELVKKNGEVDANEVRERLVSENFLTGN